MANTAIRLKKSGVTGNTPSGLSFGEVALNYADGKLYYKNSLGGTSYITNQFSFDTINSNNSLIFAGGVSDTLSFAAGNNVTIRTNTSTKTITINAVIPNGTDPGPAFNRANSSYAAQNTTAIFANAAFDKANAAYLQGSSGSTPVSMSSDLFTANGGTTTFTLSTTPTSKNYTTVVVDGITQSRNTYAVTGNVITFDTTFESGANLEVTTTAGGGALDPYAMIVANSAFDRANAAYNAANTGGSGTDSWARAQANAAFAKANTGSGGGSSITWYIANANTTIVSSSGYFVDTSSGPKTMTLPASATLGDTIRFNDLAGTFSSNNLTVAANGNKIQGLAQDLLANINQSSFGLVYSNSTYGWKVLEL
jgi:hypothetical protein